MLIDTHCHLDIMRAPIEDVVRRAQEEGVTTLITQGTNCESSAQALEIATKFPNVYATVGIHPEDIGEDFSVSNVRTFETLLNEKKVVGVGEVGLDYNLIAESKVTSQKSIVKDRQTKLFSEQIKLATKYKKSLVIHNREAVEDVLLTLQELWSPELEFHTVFHCCPADERLLQFAIIHHIYIGVDGDISWSKRKQRFIAQVPLEMLVLETDAPYLVPLDLKGVEQENEPKNVTIVRDIVARVKNTSWEVVENVTTSNAMRLFQL